ncbi:MAG TPA: hypothetical protein VHW44_07405 [Pseudonocardiaceae bacterium]|nr:hypothetical protein [Pseudonocardiaceae bacterium]
MSRAEHTTTARRSRSRRLAALAPTFLGLGLVAVLTGCGAGQITQTDTQQASVNGASGTVGAMAIRDAELAYPDNAQGVYTPGQSVSLVVTIVNTGVSDDTLTGVSTPAAAGVTVDGSATGTKLIPGGFAVSSGHDVDDSTVTPGPTTAITTTEPSNPPSEGTLPGSGAGSSSSASGTSGSAGSSVATSVNPVPGKPGAVRIVLVSLKTINGAPLRAGLTIPITFTFAYAGQVTVDTPVEAPPDNASFPATPSAGSAG